MTGTSMAGPPVRPAAAGPPARPGPLQVWRLPVHLGAHIVATVALTSVILLGAALVWRLPAIEQESRAALQQTTKGLVTRMESLLLARETRLELLERLASEARSAAHVDAILDSSVEGGDPFSASYRLSPSGTVTSIGLGRAQRHLRETLRDSDLSSLPLVRQSMADTKVTWSGTHVSPITGDLSIGVAYRDPRTASMQVAEGPRALLLRTLDMASGARSGPLWLVARSGEILAAHGEARERVGHNLRDTPLMQALLAGVAPPDAMVLDGRRLLVSAAHSRTLDWYVVGLAPTGLDDPGAREIILYTMGSLVGGLLASLLMAPFWARRMAAPLQRIVRQATRIASGEAIDRDWPQGNVAEFNTLSGRLAHMAVALQQRERKLSAVFNAAPVPMTVLDARDGFRILDVNDAWCQVMGFRRDAAVGRTGDDIGIWPHTEERDHLRQKMAEGARSVEVCFVRGDGQVLRMLTHGHRMVIDSEELMVFGSIDIGPLRRAQQGLHELNARLESRIAERTQALAQSNEALRSTVDDLRRTQAELVRAEKLAALGALVAGVAHELNTPLGNGVMAISTLQDGTRSFRQAMQAGLRRTDLQQFLEQVAQGTDIAARNLHRAADLVQNFKQVAVDQTSSQRRSFELYEVVREMVVSLRPTFSRTPYRIEVTVPAIGLRMDSYAGALGQTIGNLIQNAVLHGFEGRSRGTVHVSGERAADGGILLRVADDGCGIPYALLARIYEPFVSTRMGRGGTGLGLYLSYNAVVNLLGGTIEVHSVEGQGTCFTLHMPANAPSACTVAGTTPLP